ncbi:MAG: HEPN domain-containing protein [Methanoregula sp.]|nr:HEPN domain-containing protein [Methanoregula sp.]
MTAVDLAEIEKDKYNRWGCTKDLIPKSQENQKSALSYLIRRDLTSTVRFAFFFHEMTGCNGFEFSTYSNIRFDDYVILPNGAILVPSFYNDDEMKNGISIDDPKLIKTMEMWKNREFLYDGWIAIDQWDDEYVNKVIQGISESLSLFSLSNDLFFRWEAKYQVTKPKIFSDQVNSKRTTLRIQEINNKIRGIDEKDRRAIYRSLSWLSQGKRVDDPTARFLFFILAVESLAIHIEEKIDDTSCFFNLRTVKKTNKEREEWRVNCIKEKMTGWEIKPIQSIKNSYFDCVVGSRKMIQKHLEIVLSTGSKSIKLLFEEKIDGKTLYDLRNDIAHGNLDLLTEEQVDRISKRLLDAEKVAGYYISQVLKKSLNIEFSDL